MNSGKGSGASKGLLYVFFFFLLFSSVTKDEHLVADQRGKKEKNKPSGFYRGVGFRRLSSRRSRCWILKHMCLGGSGRATGLKGAGGAQSWCSG